jgi:hypothetical protein
MYTARAGRSGRAFTASSYREVGQQGAKRAKVALALNEPRLRARRATSRHPRPLAGAREAIEHGSALHGTCSLPCDLRE